MTTGRLAWQMNRNVRCTLRTVRRLKNIAYAYHFTSDERARDAARRAWEAVMDECAEAGRGGVAPANELRPKEAA